MTFTINEHLVMWSISAVFISIYILYDKNKYFKMVGDFLLVISLGSHNKKRILYMSFPPLLVSILSIICDVYF